MQNCIKTLINVVDYLNLLQFWNKNKVVQVYHQK